MTAFDHSNIRPVCRDQDCLFRYSPSGCGFSCGSAAYPAQDFDLFTPSAVHTAYRKCRRRKRSTINAMRFEADLENQIFSLSEELRQGTYQPGRSVVFLVEKPKRREIFAADFRDRVVHHLLVGHLEKYWEKRFIFDSHACRRGKGVHCAVKRSQTFARSVTANGTRQAHYLQLDIHGFFMNIDRRILFERLARREHHPLIQDLIRRVVFHDPREGCIFRNCGEKDCLALPQHKSLFQANPWCGLPIGNLTSQFFANVYLDALDQFVKHTLRCRRYLRYCDDFVLMDESAERLERWKHDIEVFLQQALRLELNPKWKLRRISDGLDFLGYVIRPDYLLVRRRVVGNLKQRLHALEQRLQQKGTGILPVASQTVSPGQADKQREGSSSVAPSDSAAARVVRFPRAEVDTCRQWLHSYMGHFKMASTRRLRNAVFDGHSILTAWFTRETWQLRYPAVSRATTLIEQLRCFRHMFPRRWLFVQVGGRWLSMPDYARFPAAELLGISSAVSRGQLPELKSVLCEWHIPAAYIRQGPRHNGFVYERSIEELVL